MMEPQFSSFFTLAIIVLLPVIPALLLFFALPSTAVVSGLLQGWKIDLSGAFAAYFALVLIILSTHKVWAPPPAFQVWTVDGNVFEEDGKTPLRFLQDRDLTTSPPSVSTDGTGGFRLTFNTAVGPTGNITYPHLTILRESFFPKPIDLDPAKEKDSAKELQMQWDPKTQQIHINHIVLQRPPEYAPAGEAPAPLPAPPGPHP
jgi:hypothetical protein